MSTWTEATDSFIAKVDATIGTSTGEGYTQIPEAIDLDNGGDAYLRRGFAVDIAAADRRAASVKQRSIEDRLYVISLSREVNRHATNTTGRQSLKSEMLETSEVIRKALELDNTLSGCVVDTEWTGDTGVSEFLEGDRQKYYIMGITFTVTIDFRS